MATREENLKKINDELNKLSDDELDKVAGGCMDYHTWKQQQLETFDDCPEPVEPFMCPDQPEAPIPIIENPVIDQPRITKENQQYVTRNPTINNINLTKINE